MASISESATPRWSSSTDTKTRSQTSQMEFYGADEETTIRLFRSKMKYALADAGFDQHAQDTVTSLVERNVISSGIISDDVSTSPGLVRADLMQFQLQDLLSGQFRVNSNEVALLILVKSPNQASADTIRAIKNASCAVVRDIFHIFPVRVYIALDPISSSQKARRGDGFSLALLNVVNTDIGGPGMIRLLDSEADSPDWANMILFTEAWNRTDLLWRSDQLPKSNNAAEFPSTLEEQKTLIANDETDEDGAECDEHNENTCHNPLTNSSGNGDPQSASLFAAPIPQSGDGTTSNELEEVEEPHTILVEDHPAMAEVRAREASRPQIQHPTWQHLHREESLIDLIRRQSSISKDLEDDIHVDEDVVNPTRQ